MDDVRAGASSQFNAETEMTGEYTVMNHRPLIKTCFDKEGNKQPSVSAFKLDFF